MINLLVFRVQKGFQDLETLYTVSENKKQSIDSMDFNASPYFAFLMVRPKFLTYRDIGDSLVVKKENMELQKLLDK